MLRLEALAILKLTHVDPETRQPERRHRLWPLAFRRLMKMRRRVNQEERVVHIWSLSQWREAGAIRWAQEKRNT